MNRRDLFRAAPLLGASLLAGRPASAQRRWPDPVANECVPYETGGLTHGPVLGRPSASSMRIWIRTREPAAFTVMCDTRTPFSAEAVRAHGETSAANDNTGYADVTGLRPDTRYFYGVLIKDRLIDTRMEFDSEFPSFRTFPDARSYHDPKYNPGGLFNFRYSVGFGADQSPARSGGQYGSPPVFGTLLKRHGRDLLFHVMNGDFTYEELRDGTMSGIRANYKLYYERGRTMSNFFRHVPAVFTFDDHEISLEDGAGEVGLKAGNWLRRDEGLIPWYEYAGWANYDVPHRRPILFGRAVVKAGQDVLYDAGADFSRLSRSTTSTLLVAGKQKNAGVYDLVEVLDKNRLRVRPSFAESEECRYSIGAHHYYDWKVGNCHFFALDTRSESNRYLPERALDPGRTILGKAQREWLINGVRRSDAQFIFIVSSVSWTMFHTEFHITGRVYGPGERSMKEEGFNGAVHEREILLKVFESTRKPVVIFGGDLHNAFAVQISDNVWEFMFGPMNSKAHPIGSARDAPYGGWFEAENRDVKVKWAGGWPNEVHYSRLAPSIYGVVQVNNVLKSGRQDGPGLHWVKYHAPQLVLQFYDGYTGELLYAEGISPADFARNPAK